MRKNVKEIQRKHMYSYHLSKKKKCIGMIREKLNYIELYLEDFFFFEGSCI